MIKLKITRKLMLLHVGGFFLLLFISCVSFYTLHRISQSKKIIAEEMEELLLAAHLKLAVIRMVMPVNDYLIIGAVPQEKDNFLFLAKQADELFNRLGTFKLDRQEERAYFNSAKGKFTQAKELAQKIFSFKEPYGNPEPGRLMEKMDSLAESVVQDLNKLERIVQEEHNAALRTVDEISKRSTQLFMRAMIMAFLGLGVLLIFIPRISRSLTTLHRGAKLIGKGNFSHRIQIRTGDELQDLADEFNRMAESLKGSYSLLEEKIKERTKDLERVNQELKDSQVKLVQTEKLAAIGRLAAGAAHEINNPLFVISGEVEMLLADERIDRETKEISRTILEQIERIKKIIHNLSEISRERKVERQPLDLNKLLDETISFLSYQTNMDKIKMVKELAIGLPSLSGDKTQLQEVFLNIMLNAVQSMEGENTQILTIRTHSERITHQGRRQTDKFKFEDNIAVIEIKDTGKGMDEHTLHNIFDPFFTTKEKGTGLGLFISYRIVESHGGVIEVESKLGEGSTFMVKLPLPRIT